MVLWKLDYSVVGGGGVGNNSVTVMFGLITRVPVRTIK